MKKRRYGFLTALLIFLLLCAGGCGGLSRGGGDIPVPEEYGSLNGAGTEQEEAEPASFEEAEEEEAEKFWKIWDGTEIRPEIRTE